MSKYFSYLLILALFSLSSCVTILQSLITADTIVNDNRINGTWNDNESRTIQVQQVSGTKLLQEIKDSNDKVTPDRLAFYGKQYMITHKENNLSYVWFGGLIRIQGQYYFNLVPEECINQNGNEEYNMNGMDRWTTSSIAKMEWKDNNTVTLHFLNGDYVRETVLNGRARIKYEYDPLFETFVITASSEELQEFLGKYGNNDILYKGGKTLVLSRKN